MTAAQIQTILDNLTASYTTLSAEIAQSISMPAAQRSEQYRSLEELQKQIEIWEHKLAQVAGTAQGQPYAIRFEAAP